MTYSLGVDLGTTYTAAAVHRDGRTVSVELGTRSAAVPSVVFLRDDETILTGEAANRRAATEPGRVAREFKRRLGDTTPILLGGAPYSADSLMGKLLRWVVDTVSEREGSRPDRVAVAHPANWGPYKLELLRQAIRTADLDDAVIVTEPEAAVLHYATQERVEPGATVAVYDLGGGTFDAAVVRKTAAGVELLGTPEGIERLGGIDFDEAVFTHVAASLGGALDQLDPADPAALAAVARLRAECVEAKEALSADTSVSIPVLLPNVSTEVRLTRAELEAMIRPPLADSLLAMRRALRSASVTPDDLSTVLLVGGSSRIPLVAQLVGAELGRPVAVDAHPKHAVALGAALVAAGAGSTSETDILPVPPPAPPPPAAPPEPVVAEPLAPAPAEPATAATAATPPGPSATSPAGRPAELTSTQRSRRPLMLATVAVVAVLAAVAAAFALLRDGDGDAGAGTTAATVDTGTTAVSPVTTVAPTTATGAPTTVPAVAVCPDGDDRPCIEITSVVTRGDSLVVEWTPFNFDPAIDGTHAHFYWNDIEAGQAGTNAASLGFTQGVWEITDQRPFVSVADLRPSNQPDAATEVCVTPGNAVHAVIDPSVFHCVPL